MLDVELMAGTMLVPTTSLRSQCGPSRNWVKTKCLGWKRINAGRHKMFEGLRKPELTEAQKTLSKEARGARQGAREAAIAATEPRAWRASCASMLPFWNGKSRS